MNASYIPACGSGGLVARRICFRDKDTTQENVTSQEGRKEHQSEEKEPSREGLSAQSNSKEAEDSSPGPPPLEDIPPHKLDEIELSNNGGSQKEAEINTEQAGAVTLGKVEVALRTWKRRN